ncbi:MAG: hypothetical protein QHC67_10835 [Sphingobium sp.]|uniref:hypothetical protein n=1 Tax=Sphingobium sp. TaxID=1912891 RepID=UPI0029BC6DA5|nr:hypothetical protein [Sphingobium sp.]MDX3910301.1 hypothetical protein [Sphingobium sp.]
MKVIRIGAMFLAALLYMGASGEARAAWSQGRTRHFIVYSQGSAKELTGFAEKLEKFDFLLRKMTNTPDTEPGSPVIVFMVPSSNVVEKLAGRKNVAGFYDGSRRNGYAVVARERKNGQFDLGAEEILFHEYAHHFMLHYFPAAYPAWYIEGFAEYYSVVKFPEDQSIEFGLAPLYRAYGLVLMKPLPLAQLFSGKTEKMSPPDMDRFYGTAWLLTHYFRYTSARGAEFDKYLSDMVNGTAKDADTYFKGGLKTLDAELRRYLEKRKLSANRLSPQEMPKISVQVFAVEAGQAALMTYEIRRLQAVEEDRGDKAKKAAFLAEVRPIAAKFPQSAYAQAFLAEAELAAGLDDAALADADRAIGLDPKYAPAYATKADVLLEKAREKDDPGIRKAALAAIIKGNRLDTEDAAPLVQFYRYHKMFGSEVPATAYHGLEKAFALVPQYDEYRFMLSSSYADRKQYRIAARLLDPIAFSPHDSPHKAYALKLQDALMKVESSGGTLDMMDLEAPSVELPVGK